MEKFNFTELMKQLFILSGILTAFAAGFNVIKKGVSSFSISKNPTIKDLTDKVNKHEEQIKLIKSNIGDYKIQMDNNVEYTKVICNSLMALLNHSITGDSKEKLLQAEEEMQNFLINK